MKKKLVIICEGKTEQFFCEKILRPHFAGLDIEMNHQIIAHSNGGLVKWEFLKKQVSLTLQTDLNCFVTTFIDFYGIQSRHEFPAWEAAAAKGNRGDQLSLLESALRNDIGGDFQKRFIPYIQLYEFEALVFSEYTSFTGYYSAREANFEALKAICQQFANPEEINDNPKTTPSRRLNEHIRGYDKYSDGIDICDITGLASIRNKCPRFNNWITQLENV